MLFLVKLERRQGLVVLQLQTRLKEQKSLRKPSNDGVTRLRLHIYVSPTHTHSRFSGIPYQMHEGLLQKGSTIDGR